MQAQQTKAAQASRRVEGGSSQLAAQPPTPTLERTVFAPSDTADTPSKTVSVAAPASAAAPRAQSAVPSTSHSIPATAIQLKSSSRGRPQPYSKVTSLASSEPPATTGSELSPTLKMLTDHSSPQAAPEAAQSVHLQPPRPSASSRATPSNSLIKAHMGADSASRMPSQQNHVCPTAHSVRSTARSPALNGSLLPQGTLTAQTSLKGSLACPKMSSPAANMGLTRPSLKHSAAGKRY